MSAAHLALVPAPDLMVIVGGPHAGLKVDAGERRVVVLPVEQEKFSLRADPNAPGGVDVIAYERKGLFAEGREPVFFLVPVGTPAADAVVELLNNYLPAKVRELAR